MPDTIDRIITKHKIATRILSGPAMLTMASVNDTYSYTVRVGSPHGFFDIYFNHSDQLEPASAARLILTTICRHINARTSLTPLHGHADVYPLTSLTPDHLRLLLPDDESVRALLDAVSGNV